MTKREVGESSGDYLYTDSVLYIKGERKESLKDWGKGGGESGI